MANLWDAGRIVLDDLFVRDIRLGVTSVTPQLRWPLASLSIVPTVVRSEIAPRDQLITSYYRTMPAILQSIVSNPDDALWGWIGAPWYRPEEYTFPFNSRVQEVAVVLAWFYTQERSWNEYRYNDLLADKLIATIRYFISIQLQTGAFQEYTEGPESFPATGFALFYFGYIYQLMNQQPTPLASWDSAWKERTLASLQNAMTWLFDRDTTSMYPWGVQITAYSNQPLDAVYAGYLYADILPANLVNKPRQALDGLLTYGVSGAGYFYEYYGVDFAYTIAVTLPDVADLYGLTNRQDVASAFENHINFMSYNYLIEPNKLGFIVNNVIATRTQMVSTAYTMTDLSDRIGRSSSMRTVVPLLNAFLTSREVRNQARQTWASVSSQPSTLPYGDVRPFRLVAAGQPEDFPLESERDAAIASLPYRLTASFNVARHDDGQGTGTLEDSRFRRHYVYVKRSTYYTSVYYGFVAGGMRGGPNFFYNNKMGTLIVGVYNTDVTWRVQKQSYYENRALLKTTSTIPTGSATFTLELESDTSDVLRKLRYNTYTLGMEIICTGNFTERIPLVLWTALNGQMPDQVIFHLAGGATQATTENETTAVVEAVSLVRDGLGTMMITFDSPANVTLHAEHTALPSILSGGRIIRSLDVLGSGTLSYNISVSTL